MCILMIVCAASCNQKQEEGAPDGMKKASVDGAGYSVYVPQDWIVTTGEKSLMSEARVSEEDSSNVTVMRYFNSSVEIDVTVENYEEIAIRDYWKEYMSSLESVFDKDEKGNSTMVLKDENGYKSVMGTGWKGCEAVAIEYDYTATLGGVDLYYAQIISYYDGYFYVITFTTRPDFFEDYSAYVAEIVKYIKIK